MKKLMYVPSDQEVVLENLYCDNLVVEGVLIVNGEIVAKHIKSTDGFIYARTISATSFVGYKVEASTIIVDKLIAEQVVATVIRAVRSLAVSSYVSAGLVKAGKITIADSDIADLQSDDVTYLPVKSRSLLGTLFASFMRSIWFWLNCYDGGTLGEDDEADEESEFQAYDETMPEPQEHDDLLSNDEFQKVKEIYLASKEMGCTLQIVPAESQLENQPEFQATEAVLSFSDFTVPVEENAA